MTTPTLTNRRIVVTLGTRPEAIKLAPVIHACAERSHALSCVVVATGQHRELLDEALSGFAIVPDYDLGVMTPDQTLSDVTTSILTKMGDLLESLRPGLLVVQGDTATVLASSLAAFYQKIPVGHVEAGIRSGNMWAPYPEEMNRRLADQLSSLHFAPTVCAAENLLREGICGRSIFVTGNTVVDTLMATISAHNLTSNLNNSSRQTILVTAHRRESFGQPMESICQALKMIARTNSQVEIIFPVHPNPNVTEMVFASLSRYDNIRLIEPVDYMSFAQLLLDCRLILTDSGGIQEEAATLGKPVLVLRNETDRPEAVETGVATLVGTDPARIVVCTQALLDSQEEYERMSRKSSIYGDGKAAERIVDVIGAYFSGTDLTSLPYSFSSKKS